jgi:thioredoxin 1
MPYLLHGEEIMDDAGNAGTTVEISPENYEDLTSGEGIVLVDCWAPWCGNCDQFAKIYRRVAGKHHSHTFATFNTQGQEELCSKLGVQHVPCLLVYRDGLLLFNQPGNFDESTMDDIIAQAEGLDMEVVRAEMTAQKSDKAN